MSYSSPEPTPEEVIHFHKRSDVDGSVFAQHHTLGNKPNQAAAGDHGHWGVAKYWDAKVRNLDGTGIAHTPVLYRYWSDGTFVKFILIVSVGATTGQYLSFDLPVATQSFPGVQLSIGNGIEIAASGQTVQVVRITPGVGYIVAATGGATGVAGWYLSCRGEYPIKYD